jgi:hypothetical protein
MTRERVFAAKGLKHRSRAPSSLSEPLRTLEVIQGLGEVMELPQAIVYADIDEVRMETRTAECNRLLAQGWILLGVYPLTTLGDMTEGGAKGNKQQEGQRYVRRLVGYVLGRRRE